MKSVRAPASTTHRQVPFRSYTVDEQMLPIIRWCDGLQIRTLASCQGRDDGRAYILFARLKDLHRFFVHAVMLLDGEHADRDLTHLLRRVTGARGGPDPGPEWQYEVTPSSATRNGDFIDGLWAAARFSKADLTLLTAAIATTASSPRTDSVGK